MKIYMAPMEGVTGHIYRTAHHETYSPMDKYFTPFIVPSKDRAMRGREKKDVLPENNRGMNVVPQILTNQPEAFLRLTKELEQLGYREVNLNLGCPSGTVTAKSKGAGALADPEQLDHFLESIFDGCPLAISVKSRLGIEDPAEFGKILPIYNRYPVTELILHPRVLKDYYKNTPRMEAFREAAEECSHPLIYNGNLFRTGDIARITEDFPGIDGVMLGRGLITNPGLAEDFLACGSAGGSVEASRVGLCSAGGSVEASRVGLCSGVGSVENSQARICTADGAGARRMESLRQFREFHDRFYAAQKEEQCGDKNLMFRMKELWYYMIWSFRDHEKAWKKLRKIQRAGEYETWFRELMYSGTYAPEDGFQPPQG